MHSYRAFGGTFHSAIELPELVPSDASHADWTLRVSSDAPAPLALEPLGSDVVDVGVTARAFRHDRGLRLVYDDTGIFELSADGREIVWTPPAAGADVEAVRLDLLGRVLALAFHLNGGLPLHASGATVGGRAVAIVAAKFQGKSTLAMALARAGGELLSDDVLPIELGAAALARPGIPAVRLFADSASALGVDLTTTPEAPKHTLAPSAVERHRLVAAPLDAVYMLHSVPAELATEPARRVRLGAVEGTIGIVKHAKVGALLGRGEAAALFERASRLAAAVPVYRLEIARDFTRFDDAIARIFAWHGATPALAETRA